MKALFVSLLCLLSLNNVQAADFDFVGSVSRIYLFADQYEAADYHHMAQVEFDGAPIQLQGCNQNKIAFSTAEGSSNGKEIYSMFLAAYTSGVAVRVSVHNNSPLLLGNHCHLRWVTPVK